MTSFHDLADYVAIPRVTALRLSPDGSWLAAAVQTVGGEPPAYVTSIWRIPVPGTRPRAGGRPARPADPQRRGRGRPGVPAGRQRAVHLQAACRRPGAGRPGAEAGGPDADPGRDKPALWLLPAGGGEARQVAAPPGGISRLATARGRADRRVRRAGAARRRPGRRRPQAPARPARTRASPRSCTSRAPVRYWDHDLGPDEPRLLARPGSARRGPRPSRAARAGATPRQPVTSRRTRAGRWTSTRSS